MKTEYDKRAVWELAHSSDLAQRLFKLFASMKRFREVSDLRRVRERIEGRTTPSLKKKITSTIPDQDLLKIFEEMEKIKLGTLEVSQRPQECPHRFHWSKGIKYTQLGEEALDPSNKLLPLGHNKLRSPSLIEPITITYPLRGINLMIQLPPNPTKKECQELAGLILRLST